MNRKIKLSTFSPKHFNLLLPIMKNGGEQLWLKEEQVFVFILPFLSP